MTSARLTRVPEQPYLYRRGGVLYFRRSVPPEARQAFGKTEVLVSLGTANLGEARHRWAEHLRAFDRKLAAATGRLDPTVQRNGLATARVSPSDAEMQAGVREWLADQLDRTDPLKTGTMPSAPDALSKKQDLQNLRSWAEAQPSGGGTSGFTTGWIAADIASRYAWELPEGSPAHGYLLNLLRRGLIEQSHRGIAQLDLEEVEAADAMFGPDKYVADKAQARTSLSLEAALERFLARTDLTADARTRAQYRQRLTTLIEGLGSRRSLVSITRDDCRKLRDDVVLKLPKSRTQRFPGLGLITAGGV